MSQVRSKPKNYDFRFTITLWLFIRAQLKSRDHCEIPFPTEKKEKIAFGLKQSQWSGHVALVFFSTNQG